jgi:hypothetical protein
MHVNDMRLFYSRGSQTTPIVSAADVDNLVAIWTTADWEPGEWEYSLKEDEELTG